MDARLFSQHDWQMSHPRANGGRRPLLALAFGLLALACACGPAELPTTGAGLKNASGVHQSRAARDVERPMLVDWPAVEKAALQSAAGRGIVIVRYDGKRLKLLDGCALNGSYRFDATARSQDGFEIRDRTALFAKLPLGAVGLKGEIEAGHVLALSYVAVGTRSASVDSVSSDQLAGNCAEATHFVRSMVVGAYQLTSGKQRGGSAGVEVGAAGVGGDHARESRVLRSDGDLERCTASETPADDPGCQAIVQLVLEPLGADGALGPAQPSAERAEAGTAPPAAPATSSAAADDDDADTIRQPGAQLRWHRCAIGTIWNGKGGCSGMPDRLNWKAAAEACPPGSRLPTRDELVSLLEGCDRLVGRGENGYCEGCSDSEDCKAMFESPTIRRGAYWSSTVHDDEAAHFVSFKQGQVARTVKGNQFEVLCVVE